MDPLFQILKKLKGHNADFVLIGGMAAIAHGSPMLTRDVDVCAPMTDANLLKIVAALQDLRPRLRMRPDKMPLPRELERLTGVKNLYLQTDLGLIDLLGELPGIGTFESLVNRIVVMDVGDNFMCPVLDLDTLIASKRVAGRDKDLQNIRYLEAVRRVRMQQPGLFEPPSTP
jgi:hypothetical protein